MKLSKVILFYLILFIMFNTFFYTVSKAETFGTFNIIKETEDTSYEYKEEKLYIHSGEVTVSGTSTENIVIDGIATVNINNLNITSTSGSPISIIEGNTATIRLIGENTLVAGNNYAGIEVANINGSLANLIIEGEGKLTTTGKSSAGIGGSKNNGVLSGNITINGGTIVAKGEGGGAGIGTASSSSNIKANHIQYGTITINGGNITADGYSGGAGIGGGNHADSGKIIINSGTIEHSEGRGGGAGIGSGIGSTKAKSGDEGPGYFYADIEITGGIIKEAKSEWLGAGIGGGYECDAYIKISGGIIENAIGGNGNSGSLYQGGPGIGGGYQGLVILNINGGEIRNAKGGTGSPGIGYGAAALSSKRNGAPTISYEDSIIKISDGTFKNVEGGTYAAGIGSGNGVEKCNIEISGGAFGTIKGYTSSSDEKSGAAGIGSGVGLNDTHATKYRADTSLNVSITGGDFDAIIGGWGSSGIGSGANNETISTLNLKTENTSIKAYSDGTKPAIEDTITGNNTITIDGKVLQAVTSDLIDTSNGAIFEVYNLANTLENYELNMPDSYKAFGVIVKDSSVYVVKGDEGCFSTKVTPGSDIPAGSEINPLLEVGDNKISNHTYLYPTSVTPEPVVRKIKFKTNEWVYDASEHSGQAIIDGQYSESYTIYYKLDGENEWTEELPKITNVGNIKVDVKAESSKGYETLKLSDAILKVVPKEIFVTVDNKEKMIGEKDPELTYSYDEKEIYDDDVKEALKNLKIYRKLGETAGNYEVTLESIEFENYVLKIKNGNLEIKEFLSESNGESSLSSVEGTNNPKTFDSIDKYYLVALISLLGFVVITVMKNGGLNAKSK